MAFPENGNIKKVFNAEGTVMSIEPVFSSRNKSPPSAETALESDIPCGVTEDVARLVYSDVNLTILDQIEKPKVGTSAGGMLINNENESFRIPSYYLTTEYQKPVTDYGVTQIFWDLPTSPKNIKETFINLKSNKDINKKKNINSTSPSMQQKYNNIVKIVPECFNLNFSKNKQEASRNLDVKVEPSWSLDFKSPLKTTESAQDVTVTKIVKQEIDNWSNNTSPSSASCSYISESVDDNSITVASMKQSLEQKLKKIIAEPSKDKLCGFQSASHLISSLSVKLSKKLSKNNSLSAVRVRKNRNNSDNFRFLRQTSSGRIVKRTRLASISVDCDSLIASRRKMPLKAITKSTSKLNPFITSKAKSHNKRKIKLICKKNISKLTKVFCKKSGLKELSVPPNSLAEKVVKNSIDNAETLTSENLKPSTSPDLKRKICENMTICESSPKRQKNLLSDSQLSDTFSSSDAIIDVKNEEKVVPIGTKLNGSPDDQNSMDDKKSTECAQTNICNYPCKIEFTEKDNLISLSSSNGERSLTTSVLPKSEAVEDMKINNNKKVIKNSKNTNSRLRNEVRMLIEESIKATKTIGTPQGKIRKSKCRILPNKRRTECDTLLDMLSEIRSPYTVTRLKTRKVFNAKKISHCVKSTPVKEVNIDQSKLQQNVKIGKASKQQADNKENNQSLKLNKLANKSSSKKVINSVTKTKRKVNPEVSEKKTASQTSTNIPSQTEKTKKLPKKTSAATLMSQKKKAIKMKLQFEKKKNNKAKAHGNSSKSSSSVQLINKPISIHKSLISSSVKDHKLNSNFVLRVPIISLAPATILQQHSSCAAKSVTKDKHKLPGINKGIGKKDGSKRSSMRQAESSYKFKDIILKFQKNFVQILIMSNTKLKNGLNPRVLKELKTALVSCKKDTNCRLVLLSSTGSVFCSGVDLNFLIKDNKIQRLKAATEMSKAIKDFTSLLISYPKPIVVAVNGTAIGLGMTLLTLCDVIYASDKAIFYAPYAALGQVPEGCATVMLPKCMDLAMVGDILLGNRKLTAEEACQRGLVSKVFWPSMFFEEIIPRVEKMASQSSQAMESTKALLRQHLKPELDAALEKECQFLITQWCSPECQKAMKTFLETEEVV